MIDLDSLVDPSEEDVISTAVRHEMERLKTQFDGFWQEITEFDTSTDSIRTLTNAAEMQLRFRGYYQRTQTIFAQLTEEKRRAQLRRDVAKAKAAERINHLLNNDSDVKRVSGQDARRSAAEDRAERELRVAGGCQSVYTLVYGQWERVQLVLDNLKQAQRDFQEYARTLRDAKAMGEATTPRDAGTSAQTTSF